MMLNGKLSLSLTAAIFGMLIPNLPAATINMQTFSGTFPTTITGTLANQNTVLEEMFTLPSTGTFTASTSSFATGGFQPNLTLFDASGNFVATQSIAGTSPLATTDPTGQRLDSFLSLMNLAAGKYTLALTDFELNQSLTATNLSAGFDSNFGSGTNFVDQNGNTRTGNFVINLSLTPAAAAIPEPATFWLTAPLAALFFARKRLLLIQQLNHRGIRDNNG